MLEGLTVNLQSRFEQIFPTDEGFGRSELKGAIHNANDKLYIIGKCEKFKSIYAILDLNNGEWIQMYSLTKKQNKGFPDGSDILWYNKTYVIPYISTHGYYGNKFSFGLQLNQY